MRSLINKLFRINFINVDVLIGPSRLIKAESCDISVDKKKNKHLHLPWTLTITETV